MRRISFVLRLPTWKRHKVEMTFLQPDHLSPEDVFEFSSKQRGATQGIQRERALNKFTRKNLTQEQRLAQRVLNTKWDRTRQAIPGQIARRRIANSGIYGRQLQDYAQNRQLDQQDLLMNYLNRFGELDLRRQQSEAAYANQSHDINEAKNARRATLASRLQEAM